MPRKCVNFRFARAAMSLLRCFWAVLYLWIMIHAASVSLITEKIWNEGFFYSTRLPDKLIYFDALTQVKGAEYCILGVIAAVLGTIYRSSGCLLVGCQGRGGNGKRPRMDKIGVCSPYMGAFLGCWIFSTYVTARQLFMRRPSGTSTDLYGQIILALLFKILIMAHMISVTLRAYMRLVNLILDWNRGNASSLNFGEYLTRIFCN